ncbi:hypothetical protein GLAREA_09074 [Glarea lozoyensis ATCC 20868]|uniref:DUF6594 domain-containing protein n=1 Tax=Glarea lozoyensis (strain ATCC 20868 / MF5171) TaxID=1116229 RepID=S3DYA9_GLAL2|nr:uncharacterized protein GLAREA_09074 [Glarea lozoyensis ATCC 20868]EPE36911.1 hypothetical protein GLAREA_09074 [Glarea lozoyensis ATCC 20868]
MKPPVNETEIEKGLPKTNTLKEAITRSRYPIPNFAEPLPQHYLEGLQGYAKSLSDADLNNPAISYHGTLRLYSLQHTAQELNALSNKALKAGNPTWHDLERLRLLLHDHATALKDLEYINEHLVGVSEKGVFNYNQKVHQNNLSTDTSAGWLYGIPHSDRTPSRLHTFLQSHLPRFLSWSVTEKLSQPYYYDTGHLPNEISTPIRIIAGLLVSLASACCIIVPVVVMSFNPGKAKNLITVGICVPLFGFVLAAFVRVRSEAVFVATATYAAVLVVFVGASGPSSGTN